MKKIYIFTALLLLTFLAAPTLAQRHMIHTYWHQLDGPYWIYKPAGISIAQDYIYSFGGNKSGEFVVFSSPDAGGEWNKVNRNDWPANSISASRENPQDAYYTSPGIDVFSTFDAGGEWRPSLTTPPGNLNFTVCAASPINQQKALVGCDISGGSNTLWKTENHGGDWTATGDLGAVTVLDVAWHPSDPEKVYAGVNGSLNNCFYISTNAGGDFSPVAIPDIVNVPAFALAEDNGNTFIVVAGQDASSNWKILRSTNDGADWNEVPAPGGSYTEINDTAIKAIWGTRIDFFMATDEGIYKYEALIWEQYYDNPGDNRALSLCYSSSPARLFVGTLHSFIYRNTGSNSWNRANGAMFRADLQSVWTNSESSEYAYTLNMKTGAIFDLGLDFSQFDENNPTIGLSQSNVIANISGVDGEYDGLAITGFGDNVIASSKNDQGEGKLIRFNGVTWGEVSIDGNPAFQGLALTEHYSFGAFAATGTNFFIGDGNGENWNSVGEGVQTSKINGISAYDDGSLIFICGKIENQGDVRLAYSTNLGVSWNACDFGSDNVTEVFRVERMVGGSAYYAATDLGIYKASTPDGIWINKVNQLPPGTNNITDLVTESGDYAIIPAPPSNQYEDGFVVQAIVDNGTADRFFISADSARSWNEDSSFPGDVDVKRMWNYNYPSSNGLQTGIVAATNKGLYYHPHSVINGMYIGDPASFPLYVKWGPGRIFVNGKVFVTPYETADPGFPFHLVELEVKAETEVKFTYQFQSGQVGFPGIEVNSSFIASGSDANTMPLFSSSRTAGVPGDWSGIYSKWYQHSVFPESKYFPSTGLTYSLVEYGTNGVYSECSDALGISNCLIRKNQHSGVSCLNAMDPGEDILFNIGIYDSEIRENNDHGIHIVGTAGWVDCSEPWDPKEPPPDPDTLWNPQYPPDPKKPPKLPCDYLYWTWAIVKNCEILKSSDGIMASNAQLLYALDNSIYEVGNYGIQLSSGIASWLWMNTIRSGTADNIKYSGVYLVNPFFVLAERNDIANCTKAGAETYGKGFQFILGNYFHDNGFSNIYVMDSYPSISAWYGAIPEEYPNTMIGAQVGCYIVRTDQSSLTQPWINHNRIKEYSKSGVYIVSNATPILGTSVADGHNSIAEGLNGSWNIIRDVYLPPLEPVMAKGNWWGSDDPHDFRFSGLIDYTPWLHSDPYPGSLPKTETQYTSLPSELTISQTYPNPFNSNVLVSFSLNSPGIARVSVFDLLGRRVKTVADQYLSAGEHSVVWDGQNESGGIVGSGVYFFRVESGDQAAIQKVTLLK